GNWKLHKTVADASKLAMAMRPGLEAIEGVEKVVCPPFTALSPIADLLAHSDIGVGGQNMYWEEEGAYTGEISPLMMAELAQYVILGHSERRAYFGDTDATVNRRVKAALSHGITPIVCVGETPEENEAGQTAQVVSRQVKDGLAGIELEDGEKLMVAYEPIWAIGTGKAATSAGANAVIADVIRPALEWLFGPAMAQEIRVLYGGSVKPNNAAEYFAQPDIDGALVGGASLKADDFVAIAQAAAS
ncbi:MAG: triose-phosphate isomerase, partial [Chloroflexota bacterium]|nr:triose-phosphate isomerase [Chloroflexota bacterium]